MSWAIVTACERTYIKRVHVNRTKILFEKVPLFISQRTEMESIQFSIQSTLEALRNTQRFENNQMNPLHEIKLRLNVTHTRYGVNHLLLTIAQLNASFGYTMKQVFWQATYVYAQPCCSSAVSRFEAPFSNLMTKATLEGLQKGRCLLHSIDRRNGTAAAFILQLIVSTSVFHFD